MLDTSHVNCFESKMNCLTFSLWRETLAFAHMYVNFKSLPCYGSMLHHSSVSMVNLVFYQTAMPDLRDRGYRNKQLSHTDKGKLRNHANTVVLEEAATLGESMRGNTNISVFCAMTISSTFFSESSEYCLSRCRE
jgi:hypothetical protein